MGFKDKCLEDSLISCSFSKIIVVHSSLGPMISLTVDSWPALQYKAVTCTSKNSWLLYYIVTIITPMGMSHQIDRNHSFQILHLGKRADEFSPQAPGIVLSGTKKANYQDESFQVTSSLIFFFCTSWPKFVFSNGVLPAIPGGHLKETVRTYIGVGTSQRFNLLFSWLLTCSITLSDVACQWQLIPATS